MKITINIRATIYEKHQMLIFANWFKGVNRADFDKQEITLIGHKENMFQPHVFKRRFKSGAELKQYVIGFNDAKTKKEWL